MADSDVDVAARGFRIPARLVGSINEGLGDAALDAWYADVETRLYHAFIPTAPAALDAPSTLTLYAGSAQGRSGPRTP